jgi:hypothetical protein
MINVLTVKSVSYINAHTHTRTHIHKLKAVHLFALTLWVISKGNHTWVTCHNKCSTIICNIKTVRVSVMNLLATYNIKGLFVKVILC